MSPGPDPFGGFAQVPFSLAYVVQSCRLLFPPLCVTATCRDLSLPPQMPVKVFYVKLSPMAQGQVCAPSLLEVGGQHPPCLGGTSCLACLLAMGKEPVSVDFGKYLCPTSTRTPWSVPTGILRGTLSSHESTRVE